MSTDEEDSGIGTPDAEFALEHVVLGQAESSTSSQMPTPALQQHPLPHPHQGTRQTPQQHHQQIVAGPFAPLPSHHHHMQQHQHHHQHHQQDLRLQQQRGTVLNMSVYAMLSPTPSYCG
jgi:hypothetical protein